MKLKSILSCAAALSCGLLFVQPAHATLPAPVEITLQTVTESSPNAVPLGAAPGGLYGNTSTTPCPYSTDLATDACWNPLTIQFDIAALSTSSTTPQSETIASLGDPSEPSVNFLNVTNSIGSSDGNVTSIAAYFGCDASSDLVGSIVVTNEDGSVFTFTVNPSQNDCDFSAPVSLTFTSTGGTSEGDNGTAMLYSYPNETISGSYYGTWDNSTTGQPLIHGSSGPGSAITVNVADDFSTTVTAVLPANSLGSCQASSETFTTTEAINQGQAITATLGGYSTGGDVVSTVADSGGDVLWLIGTSTDSYGKMLPAGQLFFSAYVAVAGSGLSSCPGGIFWDAPFQKLHGNAKPVLNPRPRARSKMPRRFSDRLGFREDNSDKRRDDR